MVPQREGAIGCSAHPSPDAERHRGPSFGFTGTAADLATRAATNSVDSDVRGTIGATVHTTCAHGSDPARTIISIAGPGSRSAIDADSPDACGTTIYTAGLHGGDPARTIISITGPDSRSAIDAPSPDACGTTIYTADLHGSDTISPATRLDARAS